MNFFRKLLYRLRSLFLNPKTKELPKEEKNENKELVIQVTHQENEDQYQKPFYKE